MADYKLPDVGEGLTEADIVAWRVAVGDTVAVNDVVVEIETAKSVVELPSPYAGTVAALLAVEGETVAVGTPIISITEAGAAPAPSTDDSPGTLVGYGPRETAATRRPRRVASGADAAHVQAQAAFEPGPSPEVEEVDPPAAVPAHEPAATAVGVRVLAKPPVRKLAKDLGVDLTTLVPSGPGGTVARADVEAAAAAPPPGTSYGPLHQTSRPYDVPGAREARETREPVKGVRRAMAEAMVASAFTAPHVTEWVTIDVTRTVELVERLRGHRELRGVKVTPLLVVARAALLAMRRTPEVNSWFDAGAGEVVVRHHVHLGIAAATPRGLVVPNVKHADAMALRELAEALADLTETARAGRTQPAQSSGGTFTITNVGVFGVDAGTPIINPGEAAILAVGAIRRRPWVVEVDGEERIVPRDVTTLALSFDHRHIDGEKGSRFLADVASILEDPATSLLF